ncbi:hypothetical protein D3C80_1617670 [compost metagenome]
MSPLPLISTNWLALKPTRVTTGLPASASTAIDIPALYITPLIRTPAFSVWIAVAPLASTVAVSLSSSEAVTSPIWA